MISKDIAIIMKDGETVASFFDCDRVSVFRVGEDGRTLLNMYYVNLESDDPLSVRRLVRQIADSLGSCRILAGSRIGGLFYREFDRLGFSLFEIRDTGPATLAGIAGDWEQAEEEAASCREMPACPVEPAVPGVFRLDLIRLQRERPDVSSKMALKAFLETAPFYELHLLCAHVPPWMEAGRYEIKTGPAEGSLLAVVRKSSCGRQT